MASSQPPKRRVLFVCNHNSNRSIAAEAVTRKLRPDLEARSAGTSAAGTLNPVMIAALEARGFSTEGLYSKAVDDESVQGLNNNWDVICMMGCLTKGLPYDPPQFTKVFDWALPDPAAQPELLEMVVDKIIEKVRNIE